VRWRYFYLIIKKLPWRNRTWARSASWWGSLFFFLCGLSLQRLLLNDPLDQSLHFAILAVLGEFPLVCHAHSLPQTQQSDHLRPPVGTVANTKRFLLSAKGGSRLNGAARCIPVCRAHDKKRPVDPGLSHETLFGQTTPKAACLGRRCLSSGAPGRLSFSL
jgi:hypothetical protein